MPIYEYQCAKCRKVHEIWQKITEPNATKCPACGGKIERLISASGFALKGTGWYKTDYERKGKSPKKKDGEGGGDKPSDKPSEKKAEPKSDKKDSGGDSKAQAA